MSEVSTPAEKATKPANFLTVLRHGPFRLLWLGQVISQLGDYFVFLALTVIVSSMTLDSESTTLAVAGMMISFALPRLLFGLLAGVFVDRWDRRRTMIVSDLLRMGLTLLFIPAFIAHSIPALYVIAFLASTIGTLFNPAKSALIPRLVSADELLPANSLSQTSQMLATLIGPALAGFTFFIVGVGNEWIAFVVDSLSFGVSAIAIWLIRVPAEVTRPQRSETSEQGGVRAVLSELVVGLRLIGQHRTISTLCFVMGVTLLGLGAVNVLWVVLLRDRFGLDPAELALHISVLDIAYAGAMIAASVLAGNFLTNIAPKWLLVASLMGIGLGIGMFGYLPEFWQMVGAMMIVGLFNAPLNSSVATLIQLVVPNEKLGRVSGGIGMVAETASLGSMSLAGVLGAALGVPAVFLLSGVLCLIGAALAWMLLPVIGGRAKQSQEGALAGHTEEREAVAA